MTETGLKHDTGKTMMQLIPPEAFEALGDVLTFGAKKYKPNSWQNVEPERYRAALIRNYVAELKDPGGRDIESGLLHTDHIFCNAMFLAYFNRVNGGE